MSDEHDSLLREVEEELRRERMQKIWEKYGSLIIGGLVAFVLAIGGLQYYRTSMKEAAEKAGAQFSEALRLSEQNKLDEKAQEKFKRLAAGANDGYATLAKLNLAGADAEAGKTSEAIKQFEAIVSDSSADPILRDFATLQIVSLQMGEANYTEIASRLEPLTKPSAAFRTNALELEGLAAFKAGKFDVAREKLEPLLIDQDASQQLQERVRVMLAEIAAAETSGVGTTGDQAPEDTGDAKSEEKSSAGDDKAAEKSDADDKDSGTSAAGSPKDTNTKDPE